MQPLGYGAIVLYIYILLGSLTCTSSYVLIGPSSTFRLRRRR